MNRITKMLALAILLLMTTIVMVGCKDAAEGSLQFVEWTTSTIIYAIGLLIFAVGFILKALDGYFKDSKDTWKSFVGVMMMLSSLGIGFIGFIISMRGY